jgi:16S rRNA (cytosine967-C5)-methyltransferase
VSGARGGAEGRLRAVPWRALHGLGPALDAPLAAVLAGSAAERVLDRFLRDRRALDNPARSACAEAIFGVGLWRRRLAAQLGRPLPGTAPRLLLAALLRDLGGEAGAEGLLELPPGSLPPPGPPPVGLEDRCSLPDWLGEALRREAGPETGAAAEAMNLPGPVCLRANPQRAGREALAARLAAEGLAARPGALAPDALRVGSARPNLLASPAFREGWFEVQDEGSQLLGELVEARPGDAVLDRCAGAGGKALQLAAAVGPEGIVHACDRDGARLARLAGRARRAGALGQVRVHGEAPPPGLKVTRALVDAPCSELGALRRGPDQRWRIDPAGFAALPALQLRLLREAAACVAPGGRLAYATCTFRREENEEVARAFEAAAPGWRRARPAALGPLLDAEGLLRLWPHRHGTDGFFGVAWDREG